MKKINAVWIGLSFIGICLLCNTMEIQAEEYEYDLLNRVTKVIYDDGSYVEYEYDKNGNIVSMQVTESEKDDQNSSGTDGTLGEEDKPSAGGDSTAGSGNEEDKGDSDKPSQGGNSAGGDGADGDGTPEGGNEGDSNKPATGENGADGDGTSEGGNEGDSDKPATGTDDALEDGSEGAEGSVEDDGETEEMGLFAKIVVAIKTFVNNLIQGIVDFFASLFKW